MFITYYSRQSRCHVLRQLNRGNEDMDAGPQGSQVPSLSDYPCSLWESGLYGSVHSFVRYQALLWASWSLILVNCVLFFLNNVILINLFIFGCAGSSLLYGLFSSCGAQAFHCGRFFCFGAQTRGAWASVVAAHGLSSWGFWALEHKLTGGCAPRVTCSTACGIRLDQRSNPCFLHCQVDSLSLSHQVRPG